MIDGEPNGKDHGKCNGTSGSWFGARVAVRELKLGCHDMGIQGVGFRVEGWSYHDMRV